MNLGQLFYSTKVSHFPNGTKIERVNVILQGEDNERSFVVGRNEKEDFVAVSEIINGEEVNLFLYEGKRDQYFGKERWLYKLVEVIVKVPFTLTLGDKKHPYNTGFFHKQFSELFHGVNMRIKLVGL